MTASIPRNPAPLRVVDLPGGFLMRRPVLFGAMASASLWALIIGVGYAGVRLASSVISTLPDAGPSVPDDAKAGQDGDAATDRLAGVVSSLGPLGGILLSIDYAQRLGGVDPLVSAAMQPASAGPRGSAGDDLMRQRPARPASAPAPAPSAPSSPASSPAYSGWRAELTSMLRSLGIGPGAARVALDDTLLDSVSGGDAQAAAAGGAAPAGEAETEERDRQFDALNRVLVDTGGLLLPAWAVEIQPEVRYSYKGANGLLIVEQNGNRQVMSQDSETDQLEAAVTARLGLPWSSQAEIRVPYLYASETTSFGNQSENTSASGLGDIEFALSHQFARESQYMPDLLAQVYWKTNSGKDAFDGDDRTLPLGTGFHGVGGRLTAVKTYDPVVFQGTVGYTRNFEGNKQGFDIDPGDSLYVGVGSVLAAGPGVALRTGLTMNFTSAASVDGNKIDGSDKTEGVLGIGTSINLPDNVLLDVSAGIGVTEDAPDVALRAALAYRF